MHEVAQNIISGTLEDDDFPSYEELSDARFLIVTWNRMGTFVEWALVDSLSELELIDESGSVTPKSSFYRSHGKILIDPSPLRRHSDTLVVDLTSFSALTPRGALFRYLKSAKYLVDSPTLVAPFPYNHELRCNHAIVTDAVKAHAHRGWRSGPRESCVVECFNPASTTVRYMAEVAGTTQVAVCNRCPDHEDEDFFVRWVKAMSRYRGEAGRGRWWEPEGRNPLLAETHGGYTSAACAFMVETDLQSETNLVLVRLDTAPATFLQEVVQSQATLASRGVGFDDLLRRLYAMAQGGSSVFTLPRHLFRDVSVPEGPLVSLEIDASLVSIPGMSILRQLQGLAEVMPSLRGAEVVFEVVPSVWIAFVGSSYEKRRIGTFLERTEARKALELRLERMAPEAAERRAELALAFDGDPLVWGPDPLENVHGFVVQEHGILVP